MLYQRTLRQRVLGSGVALHSGRTVRFSIQPSAAGSGIRFVRTDLSPWVEIPATADRVVETRLATTIGHGAATVGTIEHLMAALHGLGIDNARIELEGSEVPILDGSSQPFVELILRNGGTVAQRKPKRFIVIKRSVSVGVADRWARLEPSKSFEIDCTIDFEHPLISNQAMCFVYSDRAFLTEVARARTFGFVRDVVSMRAQGLALGGSLDNAIVVDDFSIQNPEGLRWPDEFVRHKVLDTIGDLALLGAPIVGRYVGYKSGHSLNTELVRVLSEDPRAYEVVEFRQRRDVEIRSLELPTLGLARLAASV
ncbi:MAG: UDP-3-O-acyl-N-acetylglucosamine deacetylase [Deltaproteobacteria bacterium]|nr:UDP-3-O-acyl-N-acetylglucosamine deacetylase [Deltaproteobacteria bacterium]